MVEFRGESAFKINDIVYLIDTPNSGVYTVTAIYLSSMYNGFEFRNKFFYDLFSFAEKTGINFKPQDGLKLTRFKNVPEINP